MYSVQERERKARLKVDLGLLDLKRKGARRPAANRIRTIKRGKSDPGIQVFQHIILARIMTPVLQWCGEAKVM